jgi:hypothetical protein
MKHFKYFLFLSIFLFIGCILLNRKNGMGVQRFDNASISMEEVSNVLEQYFPDYYIELVNVPESSSYMLLPKKGTVYVKSHHYISIRSEKYSITIQYLIDSVNTIDSYATFPGIFLNYYLLGDNIYERIDELKGPMENIKQCLLNNFPELLTENNFSEKFQPIPIH